MNLEDYAYNEGDRWYVNPQVSLDEQNAFINNLRNLQAQTNTQIGQQTRTLGTQVPSQLGGLIGGGSYFRSRYQTPQTNQTIAQLRAVNQQQALQQALNNDLAKAKKAYRDAQNSTTKKNGLNDIPLEVTDEGGDAEKYNTEYAGTSLHGKVVPGDLTAIGLIGGIPVGFSTQKGTITGTASGMLEPEKLKQNLIDLGINELTTPQNLKEQLRNKGFVFDDAEIGALWALLGRQ